MFNTCTQRAAEERLKCVICQDEEVSFFITPGDKTRLNMHIAYFVFLRLEVFSRLAAISAVAQVVWTRFDFLLLP